MASHTLAILVKAIGAARAASDLGKVNKAASGLGAVGHTLSTALGVGLERAVSAGVGMLSSAFRDGVAGAQELEKVNVATAQVIKSTGKLAGLSASQISDLANKYEDLNATIDNKVIQSGENLLLTFTNVRKNAFEPALLAALNLNQAMGGGEAGLQGAIIKVGKALQDPVKGITALRKAGVNFSDAQQKQIKDLVKHNKLYEAQKIILKELSKEFGGQFVQAGKTAEAQTASLDDSVDDLKITFAQGLMPGLSTLRQELTKTFRDPATVAAIGDLGKQLGSFLTPANIQAGIGIVKSGFEAIGKVPWNAVKEAMGIAASAAGRIFDLITGAPEWLQTAVLTGWGLNKLTGGTLGSVVSELGKGLIKGVLGINAAVVNVNGGVVNGAGGAGDLVKAAAGAGTMGLGTAAAIGIGTLTVGLIAAQAIKTASGMSDEQWQAQVNSNFVRLGGQSQTILDNLNKPKNDGLPTKQNDPTGFLNTPQGQRLTNASADTATETNATKRAVQGQTLAERINAAAQISGAAGNAARIVSAIFSARPVVTQTVTVNVTGASVTSTVTKTTRTGSSSGSAGGGRGHAPIPG